MAWRFVVAPQWQGSGSSRAMRLIDGAEAIRGDLPSSRTIDVEVPSGAGGALGTEVNRLSSILTVRDRLVQTLASLDTEETPLVIGGDCGVELGALGHALEQHPDLCVLWLDAHGDLNTPESSTSSAFGGMVLRTLLGDGTELAAPTTVLREDRVVLAGVRALDDPEVAFLEASTVRFLSADSATAETVTQAIAATGASGVYLHLDLDVLDPAEMNGVGSPIPFGLSLDAVLDIIGSVRDQTPLIGASIAGFAPESPAAADDDLPSILRILSAITAKR